MKKTVNQSGQIVVIALLVMVVVLAIALAIIGRSMLEISTSARTEESSRAFSAAEAGIERGLQDQSFGTAGNNLLSFDNSAEAMVDINANIPDAGLPLEHPPIGKESFAQFWLADPNQDPPSGGYQEGKFKIYFGAVNDSKGKPIDYQTTATNQENKPALEVMVVYLTGGEYKSMRYLYDSYPKNGNPASTDLTRSTSTNPPIPGVTGGGFSICDNDAHSIQTNITGHFSDFYCQATVPAVGSLPSNLIMIRVRVLYSSLSHPIAVGPDIVNTNVVADNIPKQATITKSTGTVGNVQRSIEVFKQQSVLPQFLDYALFSASSVNRQGEN